MQKKVDYIDLQIVQAEYYQLDENDRRIGESPRVANILAHSVEEAVEHIKLSNKKPIHVSLLSHGKDCHGISMPVQMVIAEKCYEAVKEKKKHLKSIDKNHHFTSPKLDRKIDVKG